VRGGCGLDPIGPPPQQTDGSPSRTDGPFAASLPDALTPILNRYTAVLELEPGSDAGPYLFHPPQSYFDRPMEPSAWTGWVRRLFKRHHGEEIAPKTLRSGACCGHPLYCSGPRSPCAFESLA
jgi:hypothetical protein